ncbi:unnamed protein product [Medioppia subpectinata]|uniref:Uncharacterized protein n=1 Tax=Medioppia subpectinata TaxID=1979941 RepID=A0A7R9Q5Y7_9ACAR|nr:unnamed protein product [Medioppia subpectinata]CAG2113336.1 unnamed protein product [Medioppia subpectinata]
MRVHFVITVIAEENPIDYGEQANTDAVKLRAYTLVEPIGQIMKTAEKRYKKQGLTVPIEFYGDVKDFVVATLPWVFDQFKAIGNETDRERVTAQFIGEVHGFNYMSKRLDKIRLNTPLNVPGSTTELLGKIQQTEKFILESLDHEMAIASHPVWTAFHLRIKNFMTAEFPKLYKAINKLPFEEAKLKNLQVLLADLSHATLPPL